MGGTMGRMSVGVSGLQTSQYALNATAHNLTNVQTNGYTRQQVLLTDSIYNKLGIGEVYTNKVGMGVVTAQVVGVRNTFADMSYRTENGRMAYYKAQYETASEVENYFGELEGQDMNTAINDLWTTLQELQKESNSIVTRSSFIATAQTFVDRVKEIRSGLIDYQSNLNTSVRDQVRRINEISKSIMEMNNAILGAEANGIENANDYRDVRNALIDELSGLINTEVVQNEDGTIEVYAEGRLMVTRGRVYEMESAKVLTNEQYIEKYDFTNDANDFLMPVWKDDQQAVFNIDKIPTTDTNTDIGSLKGLMMSRGYFVSSYKDVPQQPVKPIQDKFENEADYKAAMEQYEIDYKQYADDLDYYNTFVEPYTITKLMSQLDVLVNGIVKGMNDTLCPNKEVTLSDGTVVHILDVEAAGIGMGDGNEYPGTELFVRKGIPRYEKRDITLEDGTTQEAWVYSEENPDEFHTLYSIGNLEINPDLLKNPSLLPLSRETGAEAQEVVDAMLNLWQHTFSTVSPNSLVQCNYVDYYAGMMDDLGDRGYTYSSLAETEQQTVNNLEDVRQAVAGVSSDEELSNLIKFQHAYNAASRYITTVSDMIEYLVERLGA